VGRQDEPREGSLSRFLNKFLRKHPRDRIPSPSCFGDQDRKNRCQFPGTPLLARRNAALPKHRGVSCHQIPNTRWQGRTTDDEAVSAKALFNSRENSAGIK
jgi:hypothetical protein